MRLINLLAVLGTSVAMAGHAHAASRQKSAVLILDWKSGTGLSVCSSGGGRCVPLQLPHSVVPVDKIIVQKFVPHSPLSWLTIGRGNVHLCTVGSLAEPSVQCAQISNQFANLTLSVAETTYGGDLRWVVMGNASVEEKRRISEAMLTEYEKAVTALGRRRSADGMTVYSVAAGGDCMDDDGETDCESDSGGGIDGGGGSGDAGQVPIPVPPPPPLPATTDPSMPVVTITGTRPQPAPPVSSPPWYCSIFGIGCPEYVPPPPRETPVPATRLPPSTPTPPAQPRPMPRYGEGYEEAIQECLDQNMRDMEECSAYYGAYGSATWHACKERASLNLSECQAEARDTYRLPD